MKGDSYFCSSLPEPLLLASCFIHYSNNTICSFAVQWGSDKWTFSSYVPEMPLICVIYTFNKPLCGICFPLSQYNRLLLSSPVRPNHVGAGGTTPEGARPIPACCSPTTQHQNHNSKLTIIPTLEVRAGQGKVLCNYKALTIVRLLPAKRMQRNSICLCIYN